eukprot:g6296.t1
MFPNNSEVDTKGQDSSQSTRTSKCPPRAPKESDDKSSFGAGTSKHPPRPPKDSDDKSSVEPKTSKYRVDIPENMGPKPKTQSPFTKSPSKTVTKCSFSSDGLRFALCYTSGRITIWDTDHGTLIKQTQIPNTKVSAVGFLDKCNNVLFICTDDEKCWKWNIEEVSDTEPVKFLDVKEVSEIPDKAFSRRSDFFENGTCLAISTIASFQQEHKLSITLIDTRLNDPKSGLTHTEPVIVEENMVLSQVALSPEGNGMLVGLVDKELEHSYCIVWPDVKLRSGLHQKLNVGTTGRWSLNGKYIVTWTIIEKSNQVADYRSSAFIWSVKESTSNTDNCGYELKHKITNPFKAQVFWCRIIKDLGGKDRLIMGLIGKTTRFLFYNIESEAYTLTHTIETRISTEYMMFCSRDAWIQSCVNHKIVKGLSPMDVTTGGELFGAVLGWPSQVLIWDARLGVKLLRVSVNDLEPNNIKGGINLMASPSTTKFAIIGSEGAIVFCPSIPNQRETEDKQLLETQIVELVNDNVIQNKDSSYKMKFSGDGDTLGVLCVGLSKMQLWNLPRGTDCIIDAAELGGGSINDFCLSHNGEHLAACTDNSILVWKYEAKNMQPISRIRINSEVVDMGIKDDGSKIIVCMKDGSIRMCWTMIIEETSNVDAKSATSNMPSLEGDIIQERERPMTDLEESLIRHGSIPSQTPQESNGHELSVSVHYRYEMKDIARELEDATFQVSPKFEKVIRVSRSHTADELNLETEKITENAVVDIENIIKSSESYSRVSSINKKVSERLQEGQGTHLVGTSISLTKQTTVVQSSNKHIVVAANAPSSGLVQRADSTSYDVEYEAEKHEDSHSVYVINLEDAACNRRLCGKNLNPGKGLAISEDGRHVACFAEDDGSKVVVWNVYGSSHLLPDYHLLSVNGAIGSKDAIKKQVVQMIEEFGVNFFQYRHPSGMSILNEAIWCLNNSLAKIILQYATKNKIKVSFSCPAILDVPVPMADLNNVTEVAIVGKSPKTLKITLKYLLDRVTHEADMCSMFKDSLLHILAEYPRIFAHVIQDVRVLGSQHKIEISECGFQEYRFITGTGDNLILSSEDAAKFWKEEQGAECGQTRVSLIRATVRSIPYEGICNIGKEGLLHHLFIHGAHHFAFGSFLVEAVIQYKWRTYAKKMFIHELCHHILVSLSFTVYCFCLSADRTYVLQSKDGGREETSLGTLISLIVCWLLACPCLFREICQCAQYICDYKLRGLLYWLQSAWNWMEVLSYINVVIIIPLGQFLLLTEGKKTSILSSFVAVESLLVWSRMLFYARPFTHTGPLVVTVSAICHEIAYFVSLALSVMFGFALAFLVLYRHVDVPKGDSEGNSLDCWSIYGEDEDDHLRSMHESFGTFKRSLFTVFSYTYGDFNLANLYNAPEPFTALTLFVLYVVILAIILMNMLIALMSEKFTRIYNHRRTKFIQARARAIEDIDSMLSTERRLELKKTIKKILHVAIPSHHSDRMKRKSRARQSRSDWMKEM